MIIMIQLLADLQLACHYINEEEYAARFDKRVRSHEQLKKPPRLLLMSQAIFDKLKMHSIFGSKASTQPSPW